MRGMRLAEIWRYPVKSMGGERLEETVLGPLGVPHDRGIVVVDGSGRVLDARTHPVLLRHRAALGPDGRVRVDGRHWEDPEVARWVRAAAGPDARLSPASGPQRFDVLPLLVTTDGAVTALSADPRRLRPNLVVGGVRGLAERGWEGRHLRVGHAVVALADLRARCIVTTFHPDSGAQDLEVLRRVRRRFDGTFGLNAWTARSGTARVGDPVFLVDVRDAVEAPCYGRMVPGPGR